MAVKRYKPDMNKAKEVASNPTSNYGGGSDFKWFYTHKFGEYKLRVLPPWDEKGLIGLVVGKHYSIPSEESGNVEKHTCIERTHPDMGADCPICEVLRNFRDAGMDVGKYEVRNKAYMNAILLDAPKEFWESDDDLSPGDVVIFNHPTTTYDWVYQQIADPDVGDITDPENGFNIKITRKNVNGNTRYDRKIVPKATSIADSEEELAKILDEMADLSSIWSKPDDQQFEKIKAGANRLEKMLGKRISRAQESLSSPGQEAEDVAGTTPSKPSAPKKPPAPSAEDDIKVWYTLDVEEDPKEGTVGDVKSAIVDGADHEEVFVMSHDQSSGWVTAKEWGIPSTEQLNS